MKKIMSVILTLFLALSFAQPIAKGKGAESSFSGGDGSKKNPYRIEVMEDLFALSEKVNSGTEYKGTYFVLADNISVNDTSNWRRYEFNKPEREWTPIGKPGNYFKGNFDGRGFLISGLYTNSDDLYQGLFGYIKDANIKNIRVDKSYIKGKGESGLIAGCAEKSTLINCYAGGIVKGEGNIGGLVGYSIGSTLENCESLAEVAGEGYSGGIAGYAYKSSVRNSISKESVEAKMCAGGILGYCNETYVENCYSKGFVSSALHAGGIVGYIVKEKDSVKNSYSLGDVCGEMSAGGIAGTNNGIIENCYSKGNAEGTYSGGIAGINSPLNSDEEEEGLIKNCYFVKDRAKSGAGYTLYEDELDVEEVELSKLTSAYISRHILAGKYISEDDRNENKDNVWLFGEGSSPVLFFEVKEKTDVGEKIGYVLHTDILTYINGSAIPSYNINSRMAIAVKDLRQYGFCVDFNEDTKKVYIYYAGKDVTSSYSHEENTFEVGSIAMDVLSTDIRTYVGEEVTESVNADGYTLIFFRSLESFGKVSFDEKSREAHIEI